MVRVFVDADQLHDGRLLLAGAPARHLGGALRMRPGEQLVAVTPDGIEHHCTVVAATPRAVEARVVGSAPSRREPRLRVRLCQALLKGDQLERILEYGSEMGIVSFQPLLGERSVPRLDTGKLGARMERLRLVARAGAELGQRGRLPEILPPATAPESAAGAVGDGMATYLLYEGAGLRSLSSVPLDRPGGVCLLVGPEGGWTEAEVEAVRQAGAEPVTLGPRIMRPLPAALASLALVLHRAGDLELERRSE